MDRKRLNYISFSEMRDIVERAGKDNTSLPYMKNDIGMLFGGNPTTAGILQTGVPYLIEEPRIGLIRRGSARVMINMMDLSVGANTFVFIGKGSIVQANDFSPDFEICAMMVSNERFNLAANRSAADYQAGNSSVMTTPVTADEAAVAYRLFGIIWDFIHQKEVVEGSVNGLIHALLCYYDWQNKHREPTAGTPSPHARQMFERFIALVNTHCREHRALGFYADKMCITQRYLGTVVKNESGITAKEWLDRAVATAAKVLLRHTDRQITEIADTLRFSNTAFFCKFFRRMTGQSPQSYRRNPAPSDQLQ
ncbi:MAG: helix-turn-helix domain-containing protein [Prevotella sp.]|nr:helix-turn-helix domain-containing protein [Prevotella sp.]